MPRDKAGGRAFGELVIRLGGIGSGAAHVGPKADASSHKVGGHLGPPWFVCGRACGRLNINSTGGCSAVTDVRDTRGHLHVTNVPRAQDAGPEKEVMTPRDAVTFEQQFGVARGPASDGKPARFGRQARHTGQGLNRPQGIPKRTGHAPQLGLVQLVRNGCRIGSVVVEG